MSELIDLYTRPLRPDERVLSVDEKTSLQPRPRRSLTLPAQPQNIPHRHEHEYQRAGAFNLFAAFDTRSGHVYGRCYERKRQREFITFLEALDAEIDESIRTVHLVCDNVSTHHGQEVQKWCINHPRFVVHFTPVHCSWMNQVEQWFLILQRLAPTVARQLRSIVPGSEPRGLVFISDTHLDSQTTRGIRALTPPSAELLDQILAITDPFPRSSPFITVMEALLEQARVPDTMRRSGSPKKCPAASPTPRVACSAYW